MAKRNATSELTDRNWDQEDEEEEAGMFKVAEQSVLAQRKIKTARRRKLSGGESGDGTAPFKAFAGFTGLSKPAASSAAPSFAGFTGLSKPAASSAAPSFNFGSSAGQPSFNFGAKPHSNGNDTTEKKAAPTFGLTPTNGTPSEAAKPSFSFIATTVSENSSLSKSPVLKTSASEAADSSSKCSPSRANKAKYFSKLKTLNESVAKWIKDHVDKNPLCVLTPIFKDYDQHLAEIDKLNPDNVVEGESVSNKITADIKAPSFPAFSFKSDSKPHSDTKAPTLITESGQTSTSESVPPSGSTQTTTTSSLFAASSGTESSKPFGSGFTFTSTNGTSSNLFGSSTLTGTSGFSFKPNTDSGEKKETSSAGGEEEYVPPKPEVRTINEEGSVYTKRCKLFYKKEGAWTDKGVGNIHLKEVDSKTQLLIRADNNLGTILLNILLSKAMPTSKQGKNNVMLVCVPNPAIAGIEAKTATPLLIRVKTSDDADELLSKLEELKA